MKKLAIILGIAILAGAVAYTMFFRTAKYETVLPKRDKAVLAVYATGEVEPLTWAALTAPITATVKEIAVDDGDPVAQGQVLVVLDSRVEEEKLKELEAQEVFLKKEMSRKEQLLKQRVVSKFVYDRAVMDYDSIAAQIAAQKNLLERLRIISPLAGIVLRRDLEPGEMVKQGDTVFWVGKSTPLRITAEVDEEDIALIKPGQRAVIKADAFPGKAMEGTIGEITPKGDPLNKNFRVRLRLPDDTPLLIGMTVEVNVIAREVENALMIPVTSLHDGHVWKKEGRKIVKAPVKLGINDSQFVEVLDGLTDQDEILRDASQYVPE